ncbi:hypothetical protein SISSUDRAFT_1062743 [Sistotremastrum suecicum HHB10207 ss-3]|uniref:Fibronectin type III/BRCA1 domain-containing protein n=1 Tax=Sistotremastrum suecicum HHB10207 ss-3 TaxID=1314776 RepID=A0A166CID2_9AGAM|nr:hypothetical protein SISSUDRAFT_1062743 [Sistotremastrum suecicum HHB10207 ss-3]
MSAQETFMFTVGKLDAGMAILIGERAHLIEFPSILLPPGVTSGSIVNIAVNRNTTEEKRQKAEFWDLQEEILSTYGVHKPEPPVLELRNVTQTSVTLEWPPLKLATAKLRSLDIFKNGERLAAIPSATQNTSTKLSGLELNTEYTFQLVLRTTAGAYPSNVVKVRTHTMTDTSGISVCFGNVQDVVMLENAKLALREMHAKWSNKIQIDTTHFVCSTPANPGHADPSTPSVEYQRALQLSIPVVQPHWIFACHTEKKMVPISGYYLGTTPSAPISQTPFTRPASMSQMPLSQSPTKASHRASLPAKATSPPTTPFVNQSPVPRAPSPETRARSGSIIQEEAEADAEVDTVPEDHNPPKPRPSSIHTRSGTMNREFKFPPPSSESVPVKIDQSKAEPPAPVPAPPSPPPPVPPPSASRDNLEEDVGETVEVDLS